MTLIIHRLRNAHKFYSPLPYSKMLQKYFMPTQTPRT